MNLSCQTRQSVGCVGLCRGLCRVLKSSNTAKCRVCRVFWVIAHAHVCVITFSIMYMCLYKLLSKKPTWSTLIRQTQLKSLHSYPTQPYTPYIQYVKNSMKVFTNVYDGVKA
jgi:hypothetical protein